MLHTVFAVMFLIYNTFIGNLIIENRWISYTATTFLWVTNIGVILYTSFIFEDMTYECIISIVIAVVYIAILVPSFIYMSNYINNEHQQEVAEAYIEKRSYK